MVRAIEEMNVDELDVTQLKSEKVRLEMEAKLIEIRRRAVERRLDQILQSSEPTNNYEQPGPSSKEVTEPPSSSSSRNNKRQPTQKIKKRKREECRVQGCTNCIRGAGLCSEHLQRGDPDYEMNNCSTFSREDDLKLWNGHTIQGKTWVEISTQIFHGKKSENAIKNRWNSPAFKKFVNEENLGVWVGTQSARERAFALQQGRKQPPSCCKMDGCTNPIHYNNSARLCKLHFIPRKYVTRRCSVEGCTKFRRGGSAGGVCYEHGAVIKRCSVEGCTNNVQQRGLCIKHGARDDVVKCSLRGCRNVAREGGICRKHQNETRSDNLNIHKGGGGGEENYMIGDTASEEEEGDYAFVPEA